MDSATSLDKALTDVDDFRLRAPRSRSISHSPRSSEMEADKDLEKYFEMAPQRAVEAIVSNLDKKEGTKKESHAWKILCFLPSKMRCIEETTDEEKTKKQEGERKSVDSYNPPCSCFDWKFESKEKIILTEDIRKSQEIKPEDTDALQYEPTEMAYPLTVSSEQVIDEVSSCEFRTTSLRALTEFLETSLEELAMSVGATPSLPTSVDMMASDLLDTVTSSVTQLSLPQPKKFTWPWRKKKCATVSEDAVSDTAQVLKTSLGEKLRNFFCGQKITATELEDDKMKDAEKLMLEHEERRSRGILSHRSADIKSEESALTRLEKLISQEQLTLFSTMVTNRVTYMFQEKAHGLQNLSSQPQVLGDPLTTLRKELHSFIEDAVKFLLASIPFPSSFWRVEQPSQDNPTSPTSSAKTGKTYDDVVNDCSERVADQVMEHLNRSSVLNYTEDED